MWGPRAALLAWTTMCTPMMEVRCCGPTCIEANHAYTALEFGSCHCVVNFAAVCSIRTMSAIHFAGDDYDFM